MKLINEILENILKHSIKQTFPEIKDFSKLFVQPTNNSKFGDFQTNFAMIFAKILKQAPRNIALKIQENFIKNEVIEKIEIAGPGFINIFLKKEFLQTQLLEISTKKWSFSSIDTNHDVIIDYSSPNIAKPMHIGHLRTTIIGDSIKRIYDFLGYNVIADNHIGDWGTQFGKLIVAYRKWLNKENFEKNPVEELERIYIEFSNKAKEDETLNEQAREELKKLQNKDEENTKLWKKFVEITKKDCQTIYSRMGIKFDTWYGESFYHDMMFDIVKEIKEKQVAKIDDGALVVFFEEKEGLHPCIVQKKDKTFLYATSDLAAISFKMKKYNRPIALYVTDSRQGTHFAQVFQIAKKMDWEIDLEHIPYGLMTFDGEVISTRKGNAIKLSKLLDEAEKRSFEIVNKKNPKLLEKEKRNIAKIVGLGAVKYADLSQNRISTIDFKWEKALSFEGNTAPYLQYNYARIQSVKRKAKETGFNFTFDKIAKITTQEEKNLATELLKFPLVVIKSAESKKPNLIADYLFELAQKFSSFYNSTNILKANEFEKYTRLLLIDRVGFILKTGLDLLGIDVVDRM